MKCEAIGKNVGEYQAGEKKIKFTKCIQNSKVPTICLMEELKKSEFFNNFLSEFLK